MAEQGDRPGDSCKEKPGEVVAPRLIYLIGIFAENWRLDGPSGWKRKRKKAGEDMETLRPYRSLSEKTAFFSRLIILYLRFSVHT